MLLFVNLQSLRDGVFFCAPHPIHEGGPRCRPDWEGGIVSLGPKAADCQSGVTGLTRESTSIRPGQVTSLGSAEVCAPGR